MSGGRVLSVNVAPVRPLAAEGRSVMSGIAKRAVAGDVAVRPLGLAGDEQADPTVHGGLDKAVYAYPVQHYAFWQTVRAQARVAGWEEALPHGFLGENLTLEGLHEGQVWVGDVLRFPRCTLAVQAPRQPCYKFNAVMGFSQAAKLMMQSGWCGFYLAVREPGTIAAGESFELVPGPRELGIAEMFRTLSARRARG
ncbi:MAG TPA: MOSC domain-containing protein [Methylibium sp.]|nr:MOSC domain-containing protein [Methylibium sp.]